MGSQSRTQLKQLSMHAPVSNMLAKRVSNVLRDPGKQENSNNGWSLPLRYRRQLNIKNDAWDLKGEEGNSHEDENADVWYTIVYWVTTETRGHKMDLISRPCCLPHHTWPIFFADISGESFSPGTGPVFKLFQAVKGEGLGSWVFLSLLGLDCFQLIIICMSKRYFGVANFVSWH